LLSKSKCQKKRKGMEHKKKMKNCGGRKKGTPPRGGKEERGYSRRVQQKGYFKSTSENENVKRKRTEKGKKEKLAKKGRKVIDRNGREEIAYLLHFPVRQGKIKKSEGTPQSKKFLDAKTAAASLKEGGGVHPIRNGETQRDYIQNNKTKKRRR